MNTLSPRNREALLLALALVASIAAWVTVYTAQTGVLEAASLSYGALVVALFAALHVTLRIRLPFADPYLLPAMALLCGLGIAMVYRLDAEFATRQSFWLVAATVLLIAFLLIIPSHHVLERYRYVIGTVSVAALVLTAGPLGSTINGSRLWIEIGSMQVQPGEFAKLGIVIFLAAYLRDTREVLGQRMSGRHLGPLVAFWGASLLLLVFMRDFGTSLLFYGTFLVIVYVATGRAAYIAAGLAAFIAGSALVWSNVTHVRARFDIWLEPWDDQLDRGYQVIQGLYAMADGGLWGRGLGRAFLVNDNGSTVIPDAHTDFIFAALADELGYIGVVGILMVYVAVCWRGLVIAQQARDGFSRLLAVGLTATFGLQVITIVGGVVRLLPLTGQTLPFISYGGSSVLANFLLIGLLLMISGAEVREEATRRARRRHLRSQGLVAGGGA